MILFIFQITVADNVAYRVKILNIYQKIDLDKLRSADNAAFDSYDENAILDTTKALKWNSFDR